MKDSAKKSMSMTRPSCGVLTFFFTSTVTAWNRIIGIFSVEGSLYMKELGADGLYSLNPAYQPILAKATGEIRNIGKVTGIVDEQDFATNEEIRMYEAENDARDEE